MNLYQINDANGNAVTGAMSYTEAQRHMQKNRMSNKEYSIELHMPVKRETVNTETKILEFLSPATLNIHADSKAVSVNIRKTFDELDGSKTHHTLVHFEMKNGTEQDKYLDFGENASGNIYWK